jgi:predicted nucleotidyltransferase component of viral defense system
VTPRAVIELFHLVFLRGLTARLEDKTLVALKGGCNLRFFFDSVRYSEDIDFDVALIAKRTLQRKIETLLVGPTIVAPLKASRVSLVDVTAPTQTETTQRWKLGLRVDTGQTFRTKIEFSRRGRITDAKFEAIPSQRAGAYGLPPFLAMHYPAARAVVQKIHALHDRREPQPRYVFDLNHLFPRVAAEITLSKEEKSWIPSAVENAIGISFDDYLAKVVAYLEPDHIELFGSREAWNLMQSAVVERLESLAK